MRTGFFGSDRAGNRIQRRVDAGVIEFDWVAASAELFVNGRSAGLASRRTPDRRLGRAPAETG
ncbi:MAG: hypothetical protein V8T86_11265 [Victivallis sp.]